MALYEEIHATTRNKQSVIPGDFNCSYVNLNTMNGDQEGIRLLETLEGIFMTQIITLPTLEINILDFTPMTDPNPVC